LAQALQQAAGRPDSILGVGPAVGSGQHSDECTHTESLAYGLDYAAVWCPGTLTLTLLASTSTA
jgi:hypothetical protein